MFIRSPCMNNENERKCMEMKVQSMEPWGWEGNQRSRGKQSFNMSPININGQIDLFFAKLNEGPNQAVCGYN